MTSTENNAPADDYHERQAATEQAKKDLAELFDILDSREESDAGREFSPTHITTVRVQHRMQLEEILPRLREWTKG